LEAGEDIIETLKREIKEEVGCEIEILKEVGEIIEFKNEDNQKQISYCFLVKLKGKIGKPRFTKAEKEARHKVEWMPISDAIKLFQYKIPEDYTAKFIQLRDYNFLLEANELLKYL
jgi:8-oxo-dGTP diphosphatase